MSMSTTEPHPTIGLARGAVTGMVAAAVMAMFAMVASVTYQHHGFFTPLLHMSALVGSPDAMMRSASEAMAGHRFWVAAGPAAVGLFVHMMTGALFGTGFTLVARRVRRTLLVVAGAVYGLAVLVFSGLVGLPLAAAVTGAGSTISDMVNMVGWATFAVEHALFGLALGALALRFTPIADTPASATAARSAMLSR